MKNELSYIGEVRVGKTNESLRVTLLSQWHKRVKVKKGMMLDCYRRAGSDEIVLKPRRRKK